VGVEPLRAGALVDTPVAAAAMAFALREAASRVSNVAMRWTHLAALALTLPVVIAGCAAETTEDPATTPVDPTVNADDPTATDTQSEELAAKPTFATVGPIVGSTCGGCHAQFKTLAGIKADKAQMIAKISAGAMPKGNPGWKSTADGKKVLKWLKTGTDLR